MSAERMSSVDRAWLLMDRPANPMTIVGLIVLEQPIELEPLRALIGQRLLAFPRFRQTPVAGVLEGSWVETAAFSLDDHVRSIALPSPGNQRQLELLGGELASTPFPPGRPLWSFHLIGEYRGGSAIIVRIHHCYADGVALLKVLLALADAQGAGASPLQLSSSLQAAVPHTGQRLWSALLDTFRQGADLLEAGLHYTLHPGEAAGLAGEALGIGAQWLRLAALAGEPSTRLKRPLSGSRRLAWARALSLEEVHTIGRFLGCTVNDVLLSILAGALGRYLDTAGESVAGLTIRAAVPVNLKPAAPARPAADQLSLGNRFGLVFVELPIGVRHPLERLYTVQAVTKALKGSAQALATFDLLWLVGALPPNVEEYALSLFSAKVSLVASNLPGPVEALALAGRRISEVLFWVPQSGSVGAGVSMLTYCGRVQYGVMADRELIPDPARLVALLAEEFERLALLVLLGSVALEPQCASLP